MSVRDSDVAGRADVEGVCVVASCGIACGVVNGDLIEQEVLRVVDAEALDGGVFDV